MSKKPLKDLLTEIREKTDDEVVKNTVDVFVEASRMIGDQNETIEDLEKAVKDAKSATSDEIGKLKSLLEEGNGVIADRMESWEKRQIMGRIEPGRQGQDALLEAIPKSMGHLPYEYENLGRSRVKQATLFDAKDFALNAAAEAWFKLSIQQQAPQFRAKDQRRIAEDKEKLEKAFADYSRKAALAEGTITAGGAMVPSPVSATVIRQILDASLLPPRIPNFTMTSDTQLIPDLASNITAYWPNEAGTLTQGEPTFAQKTMTAKKVVGRAVFSTELAEDSTVGILGLINTLMAQSIGRTLDINIIESTATTTTNPGWAGLRAGIPAGNVVQAGSSTVGTDAAPLYGDIVDTWAAPSENSSLSGAFWICTRAVYGKLYGITDTNGQPVLRHGAGEMAPGFLLLGVPLATHGGLSDSTTSGGSLYLLGSNPGILGVRRNLSFGVSEHSQWGTDQLDAKMTARFGYVNAVEENTARLRGIDIN